MKRILLSMLIGWLSCGALGAAEEKMVWVTLGADAFQELEKSGEIFPGPFGLEAHGEENGVVITQLPSKSLPTVSEYLHHRTHRCSGFVVHSSLEEAMQAAESVLSNTYRALPSNFEIDQQTQVQQMLPDITESNILGTIQHLSTNYNNRYYQNASGEQAALWIRDLWQGYATGRSDVTVTAYDHGSYVQPSVILTIDGATTPSEVVVLGGHLDSIKSGATNTNPATIAPGADDNASGIASLSEVIRVLMSNGFTPDRTIKFMGYAAEEVGLLGSGDIAQDHADAGTNVVAVMQLDMTDFNGSVEDIALIDDNTNASLNSFVGNLIDTYQPNLQWTFSTCGYACSDHASWHNRGFPATMPFEAKLGDHNQSIHTSNDTLATLGNSAAHAVKFAKLALSFAVETGQLDCTPAAVADAGADQNINEGDSTLLGTPALAGHTYSWSPGGATTAQINVSPTTTTTYTVTTTTACGSSQDSVTVTVVPAGSNGPQNAAFDGALGAPACALAGSSCDSGSLLDGRASLGPESNQPNTLDSCTDGTSGSYHSDESNDRIVVSTLDGSDMSEGATVQLEVTVWAWSNGASDTLDLYSAADANSPSWVHIASLSPPGGGAQTLSTNFTLPNGTLQAIRANFRYQGSQSSCSGGNYDDADDLVFAVKASGPANTAPSVNVTSPTDGGSAIVGSSVTLSGTASDSEDGDLTTSLSWSSNLDGSLGSGGSLSTSSLSVGVHTLTASVTDSGGLSGNDSVAFTVNALPNTAPSVSITAPADGSSFDQGTSVTFSGTASDAEEGDLSSGLSWTSSIDGNLGSGASISTSSLSVGSHTITASVTDGGGLSGNDSMTLTIDSVGNPVTVTFISIGAEDGWVRESNETSGVGGAANSSGAGSRPIRPGDGTSDRQYKSILSFDTSTLPVGATIQSATLRLRRGTVRGSDPFTSGFGECRVDVMNGGFSGSTALQASDFQAAATATAAAVLTAPASNGDWSEGVLDAAGRSALNTSGTTQFRVYFEVDDNDDGGDDHMGYYSGDNSNTANHPQLVVTYLP